MSEASPIKPAIPRFISIACAAAIVAAGAVALLGWALDIGSLKCILPGTVSMKANTALGFLSAGLSLLLFNSAGPDDNVKRRFAWGLAAFTAVIGLATLSQYLFGWNLGIDQLLFIEPAGAVATVIPGRMAPVTAINFTLFGLALALIELYGFMALGQTLALLIGLTGLAAFAGYAYGLEKLEAAWFFLSYTKLALNTALAFIVMCLSLLFLRHGTSLLAFFARIDRTKAGLLSIFAAGLLLPVAGHMIAHLFCGVVIWQEAPLHSALEAVNAVTALLIAWLIYWLRENKKLSEDYVFVPLALTAIGLFSGLHACMNMSNSFGWLYTSAMLFGGFIFAMSWTAGQAPLRGRRLPFFPAASAILALGVFLVFYADILPPHIYNGEYTRLARSIGTASGLFFLAAAARFTLNYWRSQQLEAQLFAVFCYLKAGAGFLFFFTDFYSFDWWFWHFLRLVAHCLLLGYLIIVFRRMSEREREDEITRRAAEAASRTKSEFLSNMSHELRTPLNSIIGFTEALEDRLFGPLNAKQGEYVAFVLGSGRHLLNLVNDILDLSKVEAGKMDFDPAKTSVKELLQSANAMFETKCLERGLALKLELAAGADIEIMADGRKLKQIMFNLLSNAVKFTPDGGGITVKAIADGRRGMEISVADTGIGIAAQDLPKLFTEFTQLTAGYTRSHEGTGLGLALTRRFVEMHGGKISADSAGLGKGATFTFTLPAGGAEVLT